MPSWNPTPELAGSQSSIANRQEDNELAASQGKILDLKNFNKIFQIFLVLKTWKKNVGHFLVLKDWKKIWILFSVESLKKQVVSLFSVKRLKKKLGHVLVLKVWKKSWIELETTFITNSQSPGRTFGASCQPWGGLQLGGGSSIQPPNCFEKNIGGWGSL